MAGHFKFLLPIFCIGIDCMHTQDTDIRFDLVSSQPVIDLIDTKSYVDGVVNVNFKIMGLEHEFEEICNFYYLEIVGGPELVLFDDMCSHCIPGNPSAGFACSVIVSGDPRLEFECKVTVKPTGGALYRQNGFISLCPVPAWSPARSKCFPFASKPAAQRDPKPHADPAPTIFFPPRRRCAHAPRFPARVRSGVATRTEPRSLDSDHRRARPLMHNAQPQPASSGDGVRHAETWWRR